MHVDALTGVTGTLLKAALDVSQARHQVHALNIANASVPGYAPMRVSFEGEMERLAEAARNGGLDSSAAPLVSIEPAQDELGRPSQGVQVDVEAAEIAHNTLHYQALLRGLTKHLSLLSAAISDSRR